MRNSAVAIDGERAIYGRRLIASRAYGSHHMRVELRATFEAEADKYFWLRDAVDGSEVGELRRQVASVFTELPPGAFMMLDAAVAGEREGHLAVRRAIPGLPEEIGGVRLREALTTLADALEAAPPAPAERRVLVERALGSLDVSRLEEAIVWARMCSASPTRRARH